MPFTFSHPAIVLPLTYLPKKWFSLTGLVIGSLIPDFEYFLRMKIKSNYSHTIEGLFWFDLPLGILLAFVFHNSVRNSLFNNLPFCLKSRLKAFTHFNWNDYFKRNWYSVIISILIGASSHLLWDSFTHDHGYFVEHLPQLQESVILFGNEVAGLKLVQHTSTLIGGLVIAFAVYKLPKTKIKKEKISMNYWIISGSIIFVVLALRFMNGLEPSQYGNVIVSFISAVLISLIVTPWVVSVKV